jgi:hypothetical protein
MGRQEIDRDGHRLDRLGHHLFRLFVMLKSESQY